MDSRLKAHTVRNGQGGTAPESVYDAIERFCSHPDSPQRAVTAQDYEELVYRTPGLRIQECHVLEASAGGDGDNQVRMVVRPYAHSGFGVLTDAYRQNILKWMSDKRMIGTCLKLYAPEYIEVEVYVEISIQPHHLYGKQQIEQAVRQFFGGLTGFGQPIRYGQLYGMIDSMDPVRQIHMLSINASGNHITRNRNGDVLLPPTGVLVLKKAACVVVNS